VVQQIAKKYLSPAEYLAREDAAEFRSEYRDGEIFAMAGGSFDHNRIAGNLFERLRANLKGKPCEVFMSDVKVWIDVAQSFTYPDLVVVCGGPRPYEGRKDIVTNPLVLIEVLSESTKNYDRVEKFDLYRSLPSLREYIVVNQYAVEIHQFYREAPFRWVLTEYRELDNVLKFSSFDFQISVRDIYESVEFTPAGKL
jgi:Uma2 family endonuclease